MTIEKLKAVMANGKFHHATYRTDFARGLHIYVDGNHNFRGFSHGFMFSENDPLILAYAYHLTRNTGVSVGSYGNG